MSEDVVLSFMYIFKIRNWVTTLTLQPYHGTFQAIEGTGTLKSLLFFLTDMVVYHGHADSVK